MSAERLAVLARRFWADCAKSTISKISADRSAGERRLIRLHTAVLDGELFGDISLRSELFELREWWFKACDGVRRC